jgi:uridine kinase
VIGDKLIITQYHRQAAAQAMKTITPRLDEGRLAISVSGESGCGKSETAEVLRQEISKQGFAAVVLGQDDYFKLPPKSNAAHRQEDINWVGPGEVHLDTLNANVEALKAGAQEIIKPLIYFDEDRISEEPVTGGPFVAIIVEGTYTSMLPAVDVRVFIDRTYHQTKKARLRRARDSVVGFIEQVLEIEHQIISKEKTRANVVVPPPPDEA